MNTFKLGYFLFMAIVSTHVLASEPVTVTRHVEDVRACTVVAQVSSAPPYFWPGDDLRQMKAMTAGLQADTLLVTSRNVISRGVAYKCGASK